MTSVDTAPAIELPADRAAITVYLAEAYSEITQRPAPDPAAVLTLDSLQAVQLVGRVELDLGIDAPVDNMFGEFTLEELADQVAATLQGDRRTPATVLQVDVANRHEPFPLTAIQQAYLLGRAGLFDLGDVSTHLYMEFEHTDLDLDRLTVALRRLIDRQDMLRAVVSDDGQQRILADVSPYEIVTTDLRGRTEQEAARQLLETRERMSHQVIPADRWPLFEVRAQRVDDHRTRLHLSVDLLIADAASIALLLGEWSRLYRSPDAVVDPLEMSFRDYVLALEERRNGEQYAAARDYWISRIPELPAAPELPYDPRSTDNRFVRRWRAIDADTWAALQRRAADAGLTPSTLLCAAYADVLAAWAKDPCFTINVTLGERLPLHPQVRDLIGDFTAVTLLAVDCSWSRDFTDRAGRLQSQLRQDMEYRVFSGVEMLREMARRSDAAPRMPVVFTSMVGVGFDGSAQLFDTPTFAVSQTPQVLLDNQVLERNGRLEISWDAVDARFQPGVLDAMFDAYGELLERLAAGDPPASPGALVPASDRLLWTTANDTAQEPVDGLLHEPIARWAGETPDAPAIITTERTLSYAELDRAANQIAHRLRRLSARPNELVGVVMEKGWEQVAAVLGVLRAGAAYLPIDAALPAARIGHLLDRGEVRVALTQSWVDDHTDWPTGVERLRVDEPAGEDDTPIDCPAKPGDLAYVIFTSGSTGEPKGVMIEHRAALNTVVDVNSRFEVGPTDRTLALSSLSFDLSVYDVFGTLAAGGTIVIPDGDAGRDPVRWADLVQTHGVTIWNSVPALLGLLADAADGNRNAVGTSLRLALLSGDWIPMELPGRFRTLAPHAELVSLGGATEGSIWSIIYPITDIDPRWTSVPYGRAMVNQTMHVLGVDHEPRPVWVPGEIHIGGAGVATGYWRDEAKTTERFVRDPHTGERRYRTGDLGRLLPDGNIEFLGREDFQVKIRGYRVELGEIEAVLAEHAGVRTVVVTAASDSNGAKRLVAHYVPVPESAISDADLRDHASNRLPEYMVPSVFVASEALPLTSNGKVDRGRLVAPPEACPARHAGQTARGGRTDVEQTLARVWREVLNTADVQHDDEFLGSGGDSLLALRLVARLGAAGITIRARDILAGATFGDLCERAGVVDSDEPVATVPPVTGDVPLTPNQLWFLDQDFTDAHHWNGMWPLIMVTEQLDPVLLGAAVHRLFVHHDALRTRFHRTPDGWRATIEEPAAALPVPFSVVDLTNVPDDAVSDAVDQTCERLQASLDLETGPVIRITYLDLGPDRMPRLHVAAHWATVDYYSSRVLVEDLLTAYAQLQAGQDIRLPAKTMSVIEACNALHAEAQTDDIGDEVDYWLAPERRSAAEIPFDHATGPNVQGSARRVLVTLGQAETTRLVTELPRQYGCEVREVILTALGRAFASWTGRDSLVLDIEGHGREDVVHGDISRTVGRFSTLWPLLLHTPAGPPAEALAAVAPQVRRPRDRGVWHGLLRYVREDPELRQQLADIPPAQVGFNYWGRVDEYFNELVRPSTESPGPHRGARGMRPRPIDVLGFVAGGELALVWSYSHNLHLPETVGRLAEQTMTELRSLLGFETEPGSEHGRPRALHVDEHRPMQFDDVWSLAGLAGMTDSTEEEAR